MATVLGVINTDYAGGTGPNRNANDWTTPGYIRGREALMLDWYVAATDASGTVIKLGAPLDSGAMITGIDVLFNQANSGLTISVGDTGSATRYSSATSMATAGSFNVFNLTSTGFYIIGTNTNDSQIILTTGGASLQASTIVGIKIRYIVY